MLSMTVTINWLLFWAYCCNNCVVCRCWLKASCMIVPLHCWRVMMKNPLSACASYSLLLEKILIMPRLRYEQHIAALWNQWIIMLKLLSTSHPSEDARMARRQQNRAAQDSAAGRKILDRASKSVTSCNVDSPETKWCDSFSQSKGGKLYLAHKCSFLSGTRDWTWMWLRFYCLFT